MDLPHSYDRFHFVPPLQDKIQITKWVKLCVIWSNRIWLSSRWTSYQTIHYCRYHCHHCHRYYHYHYYHYHSHSHFHFRYCHYHWIPYILLKAAKKRKSTKRQPFFVENVVDSKYIQLTKWLNAAGIYMTILIVIKVMQSTRANKGGRNFVTCYLRLASVTHRSQMISFLSHPKITPNTWSFDIFATNKLTSNFVCSCWFCDFNLALSHIWSLY